MTLSQVLALALLQGATEFLPVSSSGHLLLFSHLLGAGPLPLSWMVLFHTGTFFAVLLAYRRDVGQLLGALWPRKGRREDGHLWRGLLAASSVTGIMALVSEPWLRSGGMSLGTAAAGWLVTGVLLWRGAQGGGGRTLDQLRWQDALWVGLFQGVALWPGFSRSGLTLAAGLWRGLAPGEAVRFSFLLSLPAIGGATLWEVMHGAHLEGNAGGLVLAGMAFAFLSGLLAISWVRDWAREGKLLWLAFYNLFLGGAVGGWWLFG